MFKELKEFILRGSVVDLAIGIVIGAAFSAIITSLVNDILMPFIGWLIGDTDFSNFFIVLSAGNTPTPYDSLAAAQEAGATTINYGLFINAILIFLIVAVILFFIIKSINRFRRKEENNFQRLPIKSVLIVKLLLALMQLNVLIVLPGWKNKGTFYGKNSLIYFLW